MTDTALVEFVAALPLHGVLIVAVVALWRENRRLQKLVEESRDLNKTNLQMMLSQNKEIESIKTHVTGQTPPRGNPSIKLSDN